MSTKEVAQAIINVFETGAVKGRYSQITLLPEDSGHLTFGRSQTTLGSGNLFHLVDAYSSASGSRYGARLSRYLPRLKERDISLDRDKRLHNLLRSTADDPVMITTQDQFFDKYYWDRAVRSATKQGITTPLGVAVVYDSTIHGSWHFIQRRTTDNIGSVRKLGERDWVAAYLKVRRHWLATHRKLILRKTVYRQDSFLDMIELDLWDLHLPLVVRGLEISDDTLTADPPDSFSGPEPGERDILFSTPMQKGLDVRQVQLGLSEAGMSIKADGWFGRGTEQTLKRWHQRQGILANGKLAMLQAAGFLDDQPSTMVG